MEFPWFISRLIINRLIYKEIENRKNEIFGKFLQSKYGDFPKINDFKKNLFQKTFEPNKLTNQEIEDLCLEFYENFISTNSRRLKKYPEAPKVIIREGL